MPMNNKREHPALELKKLTVKVGRKKIIDNLNYSFSSGKMYTIMGPNGSGKSTLARVIIGDPNYRLAKGSKIIFNGQVISSLSVAERARRGIFISFQFPPSLSGVSLYQLLRMAMEKKMDPLSLKKKIDGYAQELDLDEDLLSRSLNENASGGERKKLEVIQAAILQPKLAIFDEIDSGVDIDALKVIGVFLEKYKQKTTYILITHRDLIFHYLRPDETLIFINGRISRSGGRELIKTIEKEGYRHFYDQ